MNRKERIANYIKNQDILFYENERVLVNKTIQSCER